MRGIEVGQIWFEKNLRTLDGSPPLSPTSQFNRCACLATTNPESSRDYRFTYADVNQAGSKNKIHVVATLNFHAEQITQVRIT